MNGGWAWCWQDGPEEPKVLNFPRIPLYERAGLPALTTEQRAALQIALNHYKGDSRMQSLQSLVADTDTDTKEQA